MDQKLERRASALQLPGHERPAYFARACAGDPGLQNEIESLLAADAAAEHSFLDHALPVGEIRSQMLAGSTLGSYQLEAKLGAGGAGDVYRARHTGTNTNVALKVLPADPELRGRFEREAALAREVEHPGVASLLDAGGAEGYFCVAAEWRNPSPALESRPTPARRRARYRAPTRWRPSTKKASSIATSSREHHAQRAGRPQAD